MFRKIEWILIDHPHPSFISFHGLQRHESIIYFLKKSPWHFYFICNKFRRSSAGVTVLKILFIKVQGICLIFNKKKKLLYKQNSVWMLSFFHKLLFLSILTFAYSLPSSDRITTGTLATWDLSTHSFADRNFASSLPTLSQSYRLQVRLTGWFAGCVCVCLVLNDLQDEKWLTSRAKGIEKEVGGIMITKDPSHLFVRDTEW